MRSFRALVMAMVVLLPVAGSGARYAAEAGAQVAAVSGWVVDANSWLGQGIRGPDKRSCSVASAEAGTPLVLLTDDGSIVFPVQPVPPAGTHASNLKLEPYAEQRVTIGGKLIQQGKERAIVVEYVTRANDQASGPPTPGRETPGVEIVARVAEVNSWLGQGRSGLEQRGNTMACVSRGDPLVLVNDSGYVLYPVTKSTPSGLSANGLLMDYAEQMVRVTGTLIERGRQRAIIIDSVAAYTPEAEQANTMR